jgi:glyoxylase-like metal-dependent hydrolase (beta-lactamase superfamily II)
METTRRLAVASTVAALVGALAACKGAPANSAYATNPEVRWCTQLPRPANKALPVVDAGSDWYTVYQVDSGVYAIVEAKQFQEAIAYLVVGSTRALLFDSGIGLVPIRPVVEKLTTLPVSVLNSHTHFDHVGGNWEFTDVLGMDTPFTRANEGGKAHAMLKGEADRESLCEPVPANLDTAGLRTRPWTASRRVKDGDTLDLGGRSIEILAAPGHTPDALALFDRAHGLLFTGDTYYDSAIWLFMPETDLDAYERTMARLTALPAKRLLPAHNTASVDPARLGVVARAVRTMRTGGGTRAAQGEGRLLVTVGDVQIMTSQAALDGRRSADSLGSTGLSAKP